MNYLPRFFGRFALVSLLALSAPLAGCATTASFHSSNGAALAPVADVAVKCDEADVSALTAAGGVPIGTVDAKALATTADADDVADKAAKEAAEAGGTHVVRTSLSYDALTTITPGHTDIDCRKTMHGRDCRETQVGGTASTVEKPREEFVVFRVAPQMWSSLPEQLRPIAARD